MPAAASDRYQNVGGMLSSGGWSQSFNGIDSRSVAPIAFVVHAIAEQESILNVKAGKVCLQAGARLAIVLLVYQHRSQNLAGAMGQAVICDGAQRRTFIENVVDDQNRAAFHVGFRLKLPFQNAAGGLLAVTGGVQIFGLNRKLQSWQELTGQDQAAVHDAEQQGVTVFEAIGDGAGHGVDGGMHLLFGNQAVSFCHDLVHFSDGIGHNDRVLSKTADYTEVGRSKGGAWRYCHVCNCGYWQKTPGPVVGAGIGQYRCRGYDGSQSGEWQLA